MAKSVEELASILAKMYNEAEHREKTAMVHLFGIMYAEEIHEVGPWRVVVESKLRLTALPEVHKGMRLAKFVTVKAKFLQ
ncbi:MAG TPA: hypothetical protein VK787_13000 [Puia sp.]|jgi:hypothetical protein|nr:hypothetical protein [Puia sp.]